MNHFTKLTLLSILIITIVGALFYRYTQYSSGVDWEKTKKLCREYADRDHEKELAPERWQWFLDRGINPNTDFDWYESCLDHLTRSRW